MVDKEGPATETLRAFLIRGVTSMSPVTDLVSIPSRFSDGVLSQFECVGHHEQMQLALPGS